MITTLLQGRAGNQFFEIAMMLAYCKKYNLEYHIPDVAYHCDGRRMYFPNLITGPEIYGLEEYHELPIHATPKGDGTYNYNVSSFREIPQMDNIKFVGYWQSFKYFDWCRAYILEKFNIPYLPTSLVSIHIRRGDLLQLTDKHPPIPIDYYRKATRHFADMGYSDFLVFSDDIPWCKENLPDLLPKDINLMFQEDQDELTDIFCMSSCIHNILCYSTFGFIGAWLNQNPDKQVILPPRRFNFGGANENMIPNYFTELEFE